MTKDLVYTSGTVPSINGTIPEGIEAQTVGFSVEHSSAESLLIPLTGGCH